MGHALEDLVFFQVLGERDLHRAVEGEVAQVDAFERVDDLAQGAVAFEHLAAEALAGDFDLLGQRDFLLALEERNRPHLGQVHAHRVVDAAGVLFLNETEVNFAKLFFARGGAWAGLAFLGLRLVNQLDAMLLEDEQELVELFRIDGVVG